MTLLAHHKLPIELLNDLILLLDDQLQFLEQFTLLLKCTRVPLC